MTITTYMKLFDEDAHNRSHACINAIACDRSMTTIEQAQEAADRFADTIVSCMRCGDEDYDSVMRRVQGGDETAYICDSCYEREWATVTA